ncbi:MAG: class I SAM-dependent methyltransferase [Bilophila wadsworthia]
MGYELWARFAGEVGSSHVSPEPDARVLDIGCGGGANLAQFLKLCPQGSVCGIDFPLRRRHQPPEERRSRRRRALRSAAGDVSRLPYADASFDLVTAFETVYFWPDVSAALAEVFRVLGPSGVFLIVNEESGDSRWCSIVDGMRTYTADALADGCAPSDLSMSGPTFAERAGRCALSQGKAGFRCVSGPRRRDATYGQGGSILRAGDVCTEALSGLHVSTLSG